MRAGNVALATAAAAVRLDDDAPLLCTALERRGIAAALEIWDDATVDWSAYDLVVVRSTWDYPSRRDAFVRWARDVASVARLRNPAEVIAWNSDKRYLLELAASAVRIVPTSLHHPGQPLALPATGDYVVKPAVSAGAQDTARFSAGEHNAARALGRRLHRQGRAVIVQPYVDRVDACGETALVYLGGRFSHAVRKAAILTGPRETVGGLFAAEQIAPREATGRDRAAAEAALDAVPFDRSQLLYARVDLLPGRDGTPLVLEVELVEPSLFLQDGRWAADRLATAIAATL